MAKVFVVGPETLSVPTVDALAATLDANAGRFWAIRDFLAYELRVLAANGELQALGCASDSSLRPFFTGNVGFVVPAGVTPAITLPTSQAISGFGATLIIHIAGGISPSSSLQSAIAALQSQALSSGVLWRDGSGAVLTPQLFLPPKGLKGTLSGNTANVPVNGWIGGYKSAPTIQFSFNGSAFASLPSGAAISKLAFSFIDSGRIAAGTYTIAVQDSAFPSITSSCSVTVS